MNIMTEKSIAGPTWRRLALPASLLLNVFFIAVIGGHLLRYNAASDRAGPSLVHALANAEAILSPPDAAAFRAVMNREEPRIAESWQQLVDARRELRRQIAAEQFNRAAAKQALSAWGQHANLFLNDFGDTLIEAFAQVSPEGRRKIAADAQLRQAAPGNP